MSYSRQGYQRFLRVIEYSRKEHAQFAIFAIVEKEIEEVKGSIAESIQIGKNLSTECLQLSDEAEKQRNFELLSRGIY